ncbi:unnamed protein product [Sphagnum tenellum]
MLSPFASASLLFSAELLSPFAAAPVDSVSPEFGSSRSESSNRWCLKRSSEPRAGQAPGGPGREVLLVAAAAAGAGEEDAGTVGARLTMAGNEGSLAHCECFRCLSDTYKQICLTACSVKPFPCSRLTTFGGREVEFGHQIRIREEKLFSEPDTTDSFELDELGAEELLFGSSLRDSLKLSSSMNFCNSSM